MSVKRFRPYYLDPVNLTGHNATMRHNTHGDYVLYTDYAALEAALCEIATIEPGAECQVGCDQIARKALGFTSERSSQP